MKYLALILFLTLGTAFAKTPLDYRADILRIPRAMKFDLNAPSGITAINYNRSWAAPVIGEPDISQIPIFPYLGTQGPDANFIEFYDRIFTGADSFLNVGDDQLPITCVWVHGVDNTQIAANDPLTSAEVLRVILVTGDYSCTGPINPGWPENGLRRETWETYLQLTIKDFTLYRPSEAILRYRWNEYRLVVKEIGAD